MLICVNAVAASDADTEHRIHDIGPMGAAGYGLP